MGSSQSKTKQVKSKVSSPLRWQFAKKSSKEDEQNIFENRIKDIFFALHLTRYQFGKYVHENKNRDANERDQYNAQKIYESNSFTKNLFSVPYKRSKAPENMFVELILNLSKTHGECFKQWIIQSDIPTIVTCILIGCKVEFPEKLV